MKYFILAYFNQNEEPVFIKAKIDINVRLLCRYRGLEDWKKDKQDARKNG